MLIFLDRFGKSPLKERVLTTQLTYYLQETLSSIDLTSFLSITGQSNMQPLTRSPQKVINIPGVNDGSWTTMIKPAPPGTTMAAAKTARVHVDGGGLNNELR